MNQRLVERQTSEGPAAMTGRNSVDKGRSAVFFISTGLLLDAGYVPRGFQARFGHSEPRPVRVEEVPGGQGKSENCESVRHPRVTAGVDLPTAPKGDGGSDDHENTAEGVQWHFL